MFVCFGVLKIRSEVRDSETVGITETVSRMGTRRRGFGEGRGQMGTERVSLGLAGVCGKLGSSRGRGPEQCGGLP